MPKHTQAYDGVQLSRKTIMTNNFLGGIAWAVGTSVGLTVFVTLVGFILKQIGLVPVVGQFLLSVSDYMTHSGK